MRRSPSSPSRRSLRQSSAKKSALHTQTDQSPAPKLDPTWKSPLLWLALVVILIIAAIPVIEWYRTVRVIAVLGWDVSDSALADPTIGHTICRTQTQALKPEDIAIDIVYAETTEPIRSSQVQSVTQLFPRCQDYVKQRPATVGQAPGTSPLLLLERIETQIQIQRQAGNTHPVVAVIWLQAAEPGQNLPPLDFKVMGEQIKQITDDRGRVLIIGPTGGLRQNLDKLSAENSYLQVCSFAEHQSCVRSIFEAARTPPSTQ